MKKILLTLALPLFLFSQEGKVTNVIDGDTIVLDNKIKCRLAYIDTPESSNNPRLKKILKGCLNSSQKEMLHAGELAKKRLTSILLNQKVSYTLLGKDIHKRDVCLISKDNKSINLEMVKSGYAVPFSSYIKDTVMKKLYSNNLRLAKINKQGLWKNNEEEMKCLLKNN